MPHPRASAGATRRTPVIIEKIDEVTETLSA
jgi:hypothetical protein